MLHLIAVGHTREPVQAGAPFAFDALAGYLVNLLAVCGGVDAGVVVVGQSVIPSALTALPVLAVVRTEQYARTCPIHQLRLEPAL